MASLPVENPAIDDDVLEQMTSIAIEALIEENRSVKRPTSEDDKHFIAWSKRMRIYKRKAEAREEQEAPRPRLLRLRPQPRFSTRTSRWWRAGTSRTWTCSSAWGG